MPTPSLQISVIRGPDKGKIISLPNLEPQMIGRSSECISLTDQSISRRHAELTPEGDGRWYIRDLGSSNGTYVNQIAVKDRPVPLHAGDQVSVGNTLLIWGSADRINPLRRMVKLVGAGQMTSNIESSTDAAVPSFAGSDLHTQHLSKFELKAVYDMVSLITNTKDRSSLLSRTMDLVCDNLPSTQSFILLLNEPGNLDAGYEPISVRLNGAVPNLETTLIFSRSIATYVMRLQKSVISSSLQQDERFMSGDSISQSGIRSMVSAPLIHQNKVWGLIELDSVQTGASYTKEHLRILTTFGQLLGMGLENLRLLDARLHDEKLAAMGEAVASVSHSIKNTLQGLQSGSDLVDMGLRKHNMQLSEKGWSIVQRAHQRIQNLSLNMLQFSKKRRPEFDLVSIMNLLSEVEEATLPHATQRGCTLVFEVSKDLPPMHINNSGIYQALLNLVGNAIDATPENKGKVEVNSEFNQESCELAISIKDNGPGLPSNILKNPFQPFQSTKGYGGTGLGLPVAHKIITEHNGRLLYATPPQGGTHFVIYLPLTDSNISSDDTHTVYQHTS